MDFSHEFLLFQHGTHSTNEKLEYYQNFSTFSQHCVESLKHSETVMTLLVELKAIREAICPSCQKKCASSKATRSGNQLPAISEDSTIAIRLPKLRHVIPTLPRIPKISALWRTRAPVSSSLLTNETISLDSNSLSTKRRNESDNPIFYAERDALAESAIDITFVHSFHHKKICFLCAIQS